MASLEVLRERMDAIARGIHSAVIREASALVLKALRFPLALGFSSISV